MNRSILGLLCDPETGESLELDVVEAGDEQGDWIEEGWLVSPSSRRYPIRGGIPRFLSDVATGHAPASVATQGSVDSFGDEWNEFNFIEFRQNWLDHTVKNTFGDVSHFEGKLVVDAGAGSGAQTRWMLEAGASHVIALELSHSVDGVILRNLAGEDRSRFDIIQCSIDAPPLRPRAIEGIVYCCNVIQHTPSVEGTAEALFETVGPGGEFVFNCYQLNDYGFIRWVRLHLIYRPLRSVLSRCSFRTIKAYASAFATLRMVPGLGLFMEKCGFGAQGDVPAITGESRQQYRRRRYRAARLNTFDGFGSHTFQHLKSDDDIRALVKSLQPNASFVLNTETYFKRPPPIGCALRILR